MDDDSLLNIQDELDEARLLATAAYMGAGDVPREASGPLRTLLSLVEDHLQALSDRLGVMLGAPVEQVEADDAV